jgi:phosphate transport system substrate-binding protein
LDIYTGKIILWDELGIDVPREDAASNLVHPYQRNPNSGSQELMDDLVMQGEEMIDAPDMVMPSMIGPFNAIGSDALGIGYSVYYYATSLLPTETVQVIGINGISPTKETIKDRTYPFTTEVYVVVREGMESDSAALLFRDWLLTEAGQAIVAESGYVPLK